MKKQLADTDSIYCSSVTNSHQSSIFIAQTDSNEACSVFGTNYESNMDVVIVLSKDNLLLNLLSHYLGGVEYYERGTTTKWKLNRAWLLDKSAAVTKVFKGMTARFHASLNKETSRTYLKGITSLKPVMGGDKLDLRDYLFSGDVIELVRKEDGAILFSVIGCGGEFTSTTDNEALEKRKDEFLNWMLSNKGLGKEYAEDIAKHYLPSISDALKMPPTKTIWHGLREYLYNAAPAKGVYAVADAKEFEAIFGGLKNIFGKSYEVGKFDQTRYKACWEWSHKSNGSVRAAWLLYQEFLSWKESSTVKDQVARADDWLTVALKMFAEKRKEEEWCSDNTDGDTTKPRAGYVANKMRRSVPMAAPVVAQLQHGTAAQIRDWFKSANDPNSLKSVVDAVDDGDIVTFGPYLAHLIQPQVPAPARPAKFTRALESVARNMIAPDRFGVYDENAHKALSFLGLIDFPFSKDFTDLDYEDVLHAQRVIMRRLVEMKTPQVMEFGKAYSPSDPDWKDADYLTVHEFLWFVNDKENLKEIKNEVIRMAMKPVERKPYDKSKSKKTKFDADAEKQLMLRILAALRTKPFVILAGHSGTGKSRMVKKLAYMTCRDNALHERSDPGNYCMIEVKPNWHDSTDLLGYPSSFDGKHYVVKPLIEFIQKAYAYPDVPFFVCLDEMNLAPVEQYFAEFLSALEDIHEDADAMNAYFALNASYKPEGGSAAEEVVKYTSAPLVKALEYFDSPEMLEPKFNESRDWVKTHGLTIPKNLFVVGTVNMDETTNQFSRKVLDRAFTIEMTDARFEDFGDSAKDPAPTFVKDDDTDHELIDALLKGKKQYGKALRKKANEGDPNGQLENMNAIKGILADTPFVVAYRFANEYALYEDALNVLDGKNTDGSSKAAANALKAFDDVVLMKLLPRIAGEAAVVKAIFEGVKKSDGTKEKSGLLDLLQCSDKGDQANDTASGKKMREILRRGKRLLYLTFWP